VKSVKTEREELPIRGPLGIWPFPLLNALVLIIRALAKLSSTPAVEERRPRARTYNIVRDERGRIVAIEEIWVE
jgi:hypothetical protein